MAEILEMNRRDFLKTATTPLLMANLPIVNLETTNFRMSENGFDICVICGKITDVKSSTHIHLRRSYVEGAGQLHDSCYQKIYSPKRQTTHQELIDNFVDY